MTSVRTMTTSGISWTVSIYAALPAAHPTVPAQAHDQYTHLLTLSHTVPNAPPSYENMTLSEFETSDSNVWSYLVKTDRDTREIEVLD
jgi:hypothetical protein